MVGCLGEIRTSGTVKFLMEMTWNGKRSYNISGMGGKKGYE